jgi:hypothetical protein
MLASGSEPVEPGGAPGCVGWREPHLPQKASAGPTWFPHWLQKGIL